MGRRAAQLKQEAAHLHALEVPEGEVAKTLAGRQALLLLLSQIQSLMYPAPGGV